MKAIFDHVRKHGFLLQPDYRGEFKEFGFTETEYSDFVNDLSQKLIDNDQYTSISDPPFCVLEMPYREDGTEFILRLAIGQGSRLDLYTKEYYELSMQSKKGG